MSQVSAQTYFQKKKALCDLTRHTRWSSHVQWEVPLICPLCLATYPTSIASTLWSTTVVSGPAFCRSLLLPLLKSITPLQQERSFQKSDLIRRLLIDISQHTLAHTALCCVPTALRLDRDPKPSPCPTGSAPATLTFLSSISPATSCKGLTHLLPFSWVNPHLSTFTFWRKPSLIGSVALM